MRALKEHISSMFAVTPMIDEAIPRGIGTSLLGHRIMTYVYQSRCGVIDEQRWESTPGDGDMSVN